VYMESGVGRGPGKVNKCYLVSGRSEKLWPRSWPRSQFFTIWTDPKPVNKVTHGKINLASIAMTLVRDTCRKIWTMRSTKQIVGFVTVPAWKKSILESTLLKDTIQQPQLQCNQGCLTIINKYFYNRQLWDIGNQALWRCGHLLMIV